MATRRHVSANYLTTAEAAAYVRFRGASGIRAAVRRRELLPDGAGPRGVHLFTKETLDRFVRARAQSLGRLVSRPGLESTMARKTQHRGIMELAKNRYAIRARATCPRTGRRKEVRREAVCTLRQACALQREWSEELLRSLAIDPAPRVRLADFARSWLSGRIEAGRLKPSSAAKIASVFDIHIVPSELGSLYVDDIGPADIEKWLEGQRRKRYAPGKGSATSRRAPRTRAYSSMAILGHYRVLRTIMRAGAARYRLANPCDGVVAPSASSRQDNYLTSEELQKVLAFVEKESPEWYPAAILDAFTGLRWGELSALKWEDIDESASVVRVQRGNWKGKEQDSTKTGTVKVVPLLPEVAEVLQAHRRRMIAEQHPGLSAGWIFPTRQGGLHKGSPLGKLLARVCAAVKTGRRVTPHGFRHTLNDLLRRDARAEVTRAIIGHTTERMTHHYSHVDEAEKRAAVARVFDVVTGGKGVEEGWRHPARPIDVTTRKRKTPPFGGVDPGGATRI